MCWTARLSEVRTCTHVYLSAGALHLHSFGIPHFAPLLNRRHVGYKCLDWKSLRLNLPICGSEALPDIPLLIQHITKSLKPLYLYSYYDPSLFYVPGRPHFHSMNYYPLIFLIMCRAAHEMAQHLEEFTIDFSPKVCLVFHYIDIPQWIKPTCESHHCCHTGTQPQIPHLEELFESLPSTLRRLVFKCSASDHNRTWLLLAFPCDEVPCWTHLGEEARSGEEICSLSIFQEEVRAWADRILFGI